MANIFRLNSADQIELVPEAIRLCPVLDFLNDDQLKYIIITYDYIHGPFAKKPESERAELAIQIIYKGQKTRTEIEENPTVANAIEEYRSLIYDNVRYTLDAFKKKKDAVMIQLANADASNFQGMKNISSTLDFLTKQITIFEKAIMDEEVAIRIRGKRKESMIETLRRKKTLWQIENKNYHGAKS